MAVDVNGLTIKTVREIIEEINADILGDIDPALVLAPEEPLGQLTGIYADSEREVWEVVQIAYNAFNRDAAEGFLLDCIGALSGTVRLKAKKSKVSTTCNLDNTTTLVAGTHFAHVSGAPDRRFTPTADFTAPSTGNHTVEFESEDLGPIVANATTLTVIATPVTGWNSITNAADAVIGSDEEQDSPYRTRQEQRLAASGSGTVGALKSGVAAVEGMVNVSVLENITDAVDANGLPPHSFEVLAYDGETPAAADNDIAQAIWDNRPAGINYVGSSSGTAVDDDGNNHTVLFSRPTVKTVWIEFTHTGSITVSAIAAFIVPALQADNKPGKDVVWAEVVSEIINAGAQDVSALNLGFTDPPGTSANLSIGVREIGSYDTARVDAI